MSINKAIDDFYGRFGGMFNESMSESSIQAVKSLMHSLLPYDFEFYLTAFELIDSNGRTIMYYQLPVNPSDIEIPTNRGHVITRTLSSVSVSDSDTFVPFDINIKGTFGRMLRLMALNTSNRIELGEAGLILNQSSNMSTISNSYRIKKWASMLGTNMLVKSGYGAMKMLEIISGADTLRDSKGQPYKLLMHVYAYGESYWVKVKNITPQMSLNSNTVWNYSMNIQAIAPIDYVVGIKSRANKINNLTTGLINGIVQDTANSALKAMGI